MVDWDVLLAHWSNHASVLAPPAPPPRPGFSGAGVWRVETTAGPLAVRSWPRPGLPRARIDGLHRLLEEVSGTVPVAVPVVANNHQRLIDWLGRFWQCEPWLPGVADFHDHPTEARLAAALRSLAHFHHAASRFTPNETTREWFGQARSIPAPAVGDHLERFDRLPDARWSELVAKAQQQTDVGQAQLGLARDLVDRADRLFRIVATPVRNQLAVMAHSLFDCHAALRDTWHDHVLFEGDEVTGIIDTGSCRLDTVAGDVARLLGSLVGDDPVAWDRGLAAFQEIWPLRPHEIGLVTLLDQSGTTLAAATWVERLASGQVPQHAVDRVLDRLNGIVGRLQSLADRI